ncbi:MAG: hypothetical protein IT439_11980 [Phycisphaerales bacterium]|nr:hypothetical protein [Phycisphaerales bacterium]
MPRVSPTLALALSSGLAFAGPEVRRDEHGFAAIASGIDDGSPRGGGTGESETEWSALGPFGGDVQDVAISPVNSSIALAAVAPNGSIGGTLYRSTDGGATWAPLAQFSGVSVYDIEFDATGSTAYIGTFDGVWRSTDGGATWTNLPLGIGLNDETFNVTAHPSNPSVLYACIADALGSQTRTLNKSTDGGATWFDVTPPGAGGASGKALAINPSNPQQILAAFGGAFGGGSVWYSTDGGTSWSNVTGVMPARPFTDAIYHMGTWYVGGGQLFGSQTIGLYRSSDPLTGWTQMHDGTWPNAVLTDIEGIPGNANGVLVATVNGVHRTTDQGATWSISTGGTSPYSLNSVRFAPGSSTSVLMGANSFGVVRSTDALASNFVSSNGIGALDVYSIESNPQNPDQIAIAFQGLNNGGIYTSNDRGTTWNVETGLPGSRYNTVGWDNGTLYALNDGPTGGGVKEALYRKNGPGSWTSLGPDQGSLFESELFGMAFSTAQPGVIVLSGSDFGVAGHEPTMWRFDPGTSVWTKTYEPIDRTFEDVNVVRFAPDGAGFTLLACYTDFSSEQTGGAIRSVDGGLTWQPADDTLAIGVQGYDLSVIPGEPLSFYLADGDTGAGNGGIWRTDDAGLTWTRTVQAEGINAVAVDPADGDHLIVSTTFVQPRVRESVDGGATLGVFNQGVPTGTNCRDLSVGVGSSPAWYLATSGGTYTRDLPDTGCPADLSGSSDPNDPAYGVPDGAADAADFFYYLDQFVAGNLAEADLTGSSDPNDPSYGVPDGAIDAADFFYFLDLFVQGC